MAGEGHLGLGREDAHLCGVHGIPGRQDEGRLGQVEFGGDRLHALGRDTLRICDDRQGIAAERAVGEDIDGDVSAFHVSNLARRVNIPA